MGVSATGSSYRSWGFDKYNKQHVPTNDALNYNGNLNFLNRVDNLGKGFSGMTAADINRATTSRLGFRSPLYPQVTQAQLDAARDAFKAQLPYLAPENSRIPAGTTVDSLLKRKSESGNRVHYGKVSVMNKDAELFERLQRELAAGSEKIATRQLYQLMNGDLPTEITFSERGLSMCLSSFENKKNLVHVNTHSSVLDPKSHTITPLSVVLGHEIEHANLPTRLAIWLHKQTNTALTHGEEIRVIDGYENAMLKAMGLKPRTVHASFFVPITPSDGHTIAFPFESTSGPGVLKRGDKLEGKIVDADSTAITIEREDGSRVKFDSATLLFSIYGMAQTRRIGFEDPSSILEKYIAKAKSSATLARELDSHAVADLTFEQKIFIVIERAAMQSPDFAKKIDEWRLAAKRNDPVTIAIDHVGRINMHRTSLEPNPIGKLQAKFAAEKWHNVRNRLIAGIIITSSVALVALVVIYAIQHRKRKKEKEARMLMQAKMQIQQPQSQVLPASLFAGSQMPLSQLFAQTPQQSGAQAQPSLVASNA